MENIRYPDNLVFGLDIGTRSLVGTVGFKENENKFKVVAQFIKEHDTRAMMDGQIHDINRVAESILGVKRELEKQTGRKLDEVCIAAAGRVLKTVTVKADLEFENEKNITDEDIHSLELIGIEKAYDKIKEETKKQKINFYCVGYSVIKYCLNDYIMMKLEGHKANKISAELIATFLPEEVIDGLYSAVEKAGLKVVNLTLEPIAAINVAIPEKFRLLNIALVDVGAGTSDICITKDGSIIAYGMIPLAGDEISETIVHKYLVDFNTAEKIKLSCLKRKMISYKDIMGITHKTAAADIIESIDDTVNNITKQIAGKIVELNGGKYVSAVFVVGGGGKISGFAASLAKYLKLMPERVALRGEEVLGEVEFTQPGIKKDPLLVTPIGICLNYYEHRNNFVFVNVNSEIVKLYNNSRLTIMDAAIQVGFPNEELFPRRGKEINYVLDGHKRRVRGESGEPAVIKLNGKNSSLNTPISQDDIIEIIPSTVGEAATCQIKQLPEYKATISFIFNGQKIICPKFVVVNDKLVSEFYTIKDNDNIKILDYYTLKQILEFMDIQYNENIEVNNIPASPDEIVYENFSISCNLSHEIEKIKEDKMLILKKENKETEVENSNKSTVEIVVSVNGEKVVLKGKAEYIFVDILDFYTFDLSVPRGRTVVMRLNGKKAEFTDKIYDNCIAELYWEE